MSERSSCVLGVDLGTSALKLAAVGRDGRVIATARAKYPTLSTAEGQAEQNPEHWLEALSVAARKIRSHLGKQARIEAISLTGQMPTLVVTGKDRLDRHKSGGHTPVGHAITWEDSRADPWVSQRLDDRFRRKTYLKTGVLIDGRYLAPMFQFHYSSKSGQADLIFSAKDFLFQVLTDLARTDPSTASGYGLYNLRLKAWDPELCSFWSIPVERLPAIESSSFRAPLSERGSRLLGCKPSTPVVLGCADSVAGAHALRRGKADSHTATVLTGSSTVILKSDARPRWDKRNRFLVTPLALDGAYGREADLLASGSAREWATRLLESNHKKSVWERACDMAPGADGLMFAPFLAGGEQGILWNPGLRGTISGLSLAHTGAHIARALLEGMCFEIRRCLEVFEQESRLSSIRLAGWMADLPLQSQMLADILDRPVHAFQMESASAVGAAMLSGLIDTRKYSEETRPIILRPTPRKYLYHALYAKYVSQFPASL